MYAPESARWLTGDPLPLETVTPGIRYGMQAPVSFAMSRWQYAHNSPCQLADPSGLFAIDVRGVSPCSTALSPYVDFIDDDILFKYPWEDSPSEQCGCCHDFRDQSTNGTGCFEIEAGRKNCTAFVFCRDNCGSDPDGNVLANTISSGLQIRICIRCDTHPLLMEMVLVHELIHAKQRCISDPPWWDAAGPCRRCLHREEPAHKASCRVLWRDVDPIAFDYYYERCWKCALHISCGHHKLRGGRPCYPDRQRPPCTDRDTQRWGTD